MKAHSAIQDYATCKKSWGSKQFTTTPNSQTETPPTWLVNFHRGVYSGKPVCQVLPKHYLFYGTLVKTVLFLD